MMTYEEDPDILERIVTGNETWVHHYELKSKRQSMEWKHPSSTVRKKFEQQPSCKKLMLTFVWDMGGGPILAKFQVHGETEQLQIFCFAARPIKTCNSSRMTGTTVQRVAIAPRQCTATYSNSSGTDWTKA
jgi:hypothetical protein